MVTIKAISYFKSILGFSEKYFHVTGETTLRELISLNLPDDRIVIILNHTKGATMDTIISGDDYLLISPVFGGGK